MATVTAITPVPAQTRHHRDPAAAEISLRLDDLFGPGAARQFAERLPGNSLAQRIAAAGESLS